jgi:hypothetical protein
MWGFRVALHTLPQPADKIRHTADAIFLGRGEHIAFSVVQQLSEGGARHG